MPRRTVDVAQDLVPIGEFKTHASALLRRLRAQRRPLVITQNGRAAAVVLTPAEYEALAEPERVRRQIDAGLASAARGETFTIEHARAYFAAKTKRRG